MFLECKVLYKDDDVMQLKVYMYKFYVHKTRIKIKIRSIGLKTVHNTFLRNGYNKYDCVNVLLMGKGWEVKSILTGEKSYVSIDKKYYKELYDAVGTNKTVKLTK